MDVPYLHTGRTNQKARTRDALIAAARQLLAEGVTPTVEEAAAEASVGRTTAYRYFPNSRALLVATTFPELELDSLLGAVPPDDPLARVTILAESLTQRIIDHEPEYRAQLRLALEGEPAGSESLPLRRGRRIAWVKDALSPLRGRMPEPELRRLELGIGATIGIEAFVWLTDMGGLSREEAAEVMRSNARTLLRSALERLESSE